MSSSVPQAMQRQRLRTLLTLPFTALILAPALIIALTSLYTGLKAVDALSARVIGDVASRVEQAAVHQLEEATITLRSVVPAQANAFDASAALFSDRDWIERKLFELTAATRTTAYLYFGGEEGSFIGVDRGRPGALAAATVRVGEREGVPRKIYTASRPGDRSRLAEIERRQFDARTRPWYVKAKTDRRLAWTPVYLSFASNSLVTTAATPVASADGRLTGVLAADVELSELSTFMKTLSVSENGIAFIVDGEGYLVASASPGQPFREIDGNPQRIKAEDSSDLVERDAAMWWRNAHVQQSALSRTRQRPDFLAAKIAGSSGAAIDVASRRIVQIDGVDWDIVVAIPRSDLTAPVVRSTLIMFFIILAALIASLQLGLWIVRRVTRDVDALVKATNMDSLSSERFEAPKTTLRETSVLAAAFTGMFERLRESLSTIRKQNEDLASLNASLEERVARRTAQLEAKNFELTSEITRREQLQQDLRIATDATVKQADDKARFMAMLSHELRTPLQAVIGASELLARKDDAHAHEAKVLDTASKSLLTLIDGVLSYSKLEAGKVVPLRSVFDVRALANEAIELARAAQRDRAPTITVAVRDSVPQRLFTDAGMLRQLLVNLVSNAIKHAKDGCIDVVLAREEIAATTMANDSSSFRLRVSVADDGPGIPSEAQHLLFQPFQQIGRGASDPSQGSGLGLSICAMLVRALDGDIGLSPRAAPGTEIEFSIVVQDATHAQIEAISAVDIAAARGGESNGDAMSLSILLVDDHRVNLRLVNEMLGVLGHQVVLADSGEAALDQVRARTVSGGTAQALAPFDVVFMDLNLPGMSGIETVQAIRAHCQHVHTREPLFVALTASTSEVDRIACEEVGMTLRVTKPATVATLDGILRAASRRLTSHVVATPSAPSTVASDAPTESVIAWHTLDQLRSLERQGSDAFVAPLVRDFLSGLDAEFNDVVIAIREGAQRAATKRAHALAGAALAVGASALALLLKPPQFQANAEDIGPLERCLVQTKHALHEWLEKHENTGKR